MADLTRLSAAWRISCRFWRHSTKQRLPPNTGNLSGNELNGLKDFGSVATTRIGFSAHVRRRETNLIKRRCQRLARFSIVDPGLFNSVFFGQQPGAMRFGVALASTWSKIDQVHGPPISPGKKQRDDVFSSSTLILFDDDEHFIQDSQTQRRFAPMLFTIDRNPRSRSSESAVEQCRLADSAKTCEH